jgi:hypothetical protein
MTRGQQYAAVSDIVAAKDEMKIAKVAQQQGSAPTRSSIIAMLIYMNMQLHLASSLTDDNIRAIADDLTNNPEIKLWLTLADVQLLCRNILNGTYAHYYNRFGLDTFYECFNKYCNERNAVHHLLADKKQVAEPEVLEEVGYKMDTHGNLIVPEKLQGVAKKKPMRYLYNEKCEIVGENPAFWGKVRQEKSRDEMAKINKSNRVMELTRALLKADPTLGYLKAVELAAEEVEKEEKEALEKEVTT